MKRLIVLALLSTLAGHAGQILYSSNFGNNTVTAYDAVTGAPLGTPITAGAELAGLNGVRLEPSGSFVVTGQLTNNVARYSRSGTLLSVFDPLKLAQLDSPQDLTFGPDGMLYVASAGDDRIVRFDPATGAYIDTFANLGGSGHLGPIGVSFGPDGNLYVSGFDNAVVVKVDGTTGSVLNTAVGPAGVGFGPGVFGPDGNLYVVALNLSSFAGSVYRYDSVTQSISEFIPEGAGGLISPGGLAFGPGGSLLLSNLVADINFADAGSTVLRFNGTTAAFQGTLVGPGNGLNLPFFLTVAEPIPEPGTWALLGGGLMVLLHSMRARKGPRSQ